MAEASWKGFGFEGGESVKRLLIVVDYQNDFVDGALGFEGAELLDGRIARKIDEYREAGDYISFTFDTHHKDYLETQEGRNLPVPHCIEGTHGHDLYGRVAERMHDSDDVFLKPTFGSTALFERLLKRHMEGGKTAEEAAEIIDGSDMLNADLCLRRSAPADLTLRLDGEGRYSILP